MSDSFDWGDIINAALAVYGMNQANKPPKFYDVPQTPQDAWKTNAGQNLFNYSSAYTDQFLRGLGDLNPNWQMSTSALGNPSFMGGVRVPTIDWSKMPSAPNAAAPAPTTTGAKGGPVPSLGGDVGGYGTYASGMEPGDAGRKQKLPNMAAPPDGAGPGALIGSQQPFDPNMSGRPGIDPRYPAGSNPNVVDIFKDRSPGFGSSAGNDTQGSKPGSNTGDAAFDYAYNYLVNNPQGKGWWANFTTSHPNWAKDLTNSAAAIATMFSIPVGVALKVISSLIPSHTAPTTPTTPTTPVATKP